MEDEKNPFPPIQSGRLNILLCKGAPEYINENRLNEIYMNNFQRLYKEECNPTTRQQFIPIYTVSCSWTPPLSLGSLLPTPSGVQCLRPLVNGWKHRQCHQPGRQAGEERHKQCSSWSKKAIRLIASSNDSTSRIKRRSPSLFLIPLRPELVGAY